MADERAALYAWHALFLSEPSRSAGAGSPGNSLQQESVVGSAEAADGSGSDSDSDSDSGSDDGFTPWREDAGSGERDAAAAAHLAAQPTAPPYWRSRYAARAGAYWEDFYQRNQANFFKDRHYLLRDFGRFLGPGASAPLRLIELGCGCGNALLPLAARLPRLRAVAFDFSRSAIALLREALARGDAERPGLGLRERVVCFARDAAAPGLAADAAREAAAAASAAAAGPAVPPLPPQPALQGGFDVALMLFMLSAMPPEQHVRILREAALALRPGGVLLFRDYGFGDAAQLRFARGKMLDRDGALFARQDGTLAYFFGLPRLRAICAAAGLEEAEEGSARALFRRYTNRKERLELRRVFVQGAWRRPGAALAGAGGFVG